jgi:IMP cyclohydrolase
MEVIKMAGKIFLEEKPYYGRGIIQGITPSGQKAIQLYWTMGRSELSRKRVFSKTGQEVVIRLLDNYSDTDTSLVEYTPVRQVEGWHIVANGDQTDRIKAGIGKNEKSVYEILFNEQYEYDPPINTPRITALMNVTKGVRSILSIVKCDATTLGNNRQIFEYEKAENGAGRCITTYSGDDIDPKPFSGEPIKVELFNDLEECIHFYWSRLSKYRVSILGKSVDLKSEKVDLLTINEFHNNRCKDV